MAVKNWIKHKNMTDVVAMVRSESTDGLGNKLLTVWWWNTGRAMGLNPFPMYKNASKPAVEEIKVPEAEFDSWIQADAVEELV